MAPSLSAGERPAQKASRRRLIQPVLPALPQFPSSGRKQQPTAQAVEIDTHSDLGLQTEQSSRRPSTIGSIDLTNSRHDAIPQHQELEAPLSSERPDVDDTHLTAEFSTEEPRPIHQPTPPPFPPRLPDTESVERDLHSGLLRPDTSESLDNDSTANSASRPSSRSDFHQLMYAEQPNSLQHPTVLEDHSRRTMSQMEDPTASEPAPSPRPRLETEQVRMVELPVQPNGILVDDWPRRSSRDWSDSNPDEIDAKEEALQKEFDAQNAQNENSSLILAHINDPDESVNGNSTFLSAKEELSFAPRLPRFSTAYDPSIFPNGHPNDGLNHGPFLASAIQASESVADGELKTLSNHLSSIFLTREWVDWAIEVTSPNPKHGTLGFHIHSMIIARSPVLREKLRHQISIAHPENVITIAPERHIQPPAFEDALRYLYTDQVLTRAAAEQQFVINSDPGSKVSREYLLDCCLSYWTAGLVLGLQPVAKQAQSIVRDVLGWDILETAFQEVVTMSERRSVSPVLYEGFRALSVTPQSSRAPSATSPWTRSGSPPSERHTSIASGLELDQQSPGVNEVISRGLKALILDFIASKSDISIFSDDGGMPARSYLPDTREYSGSSRHTTNPALAAIRFGAMPLPDEEPTHEEPTETATSRTPQAISAAILLSLEYPDFRAFCLVLKEHQLTLELGGERVHDWITSVVEAREERRKKVLATKTISNQERKAKERKWTVVGWEESIQSAKSVGGWELTRNWTGYILPGRA